jgi:type I restriction enzyme M protein
MTEHKQKQLGKMRCAIADQLCGWMVADDFRDDMLSFLFLRYLSDNYEAAAQKELGSDYPNADVDVKQVPLAVWYSANTEELPSFEKKMRRNVHCVISPARL